MSAISKRAWTGSFRCEFRNFPIYFFVCAVRARLLNRRFFVSSAQTCDALDGNFVAFGLNQAGGAERHARDSPQALAAIVGSFVRSNAEFRRQCDATRAEIRQIRASFGKLEAAPVNSAKELIALAKVAHITLGASSVLAAEIERCDAAGHVRRQLDQCRQLYAYAMQDS